MIYLFSGIFYKYFYLLLFYIFIFISAALQPSKTNLLLKTIHIRLFLSYASLMIVFACNFVSVVFRIGHSCFLRETLIGMESSIFPNPVVFSYLKDNIIL